MKLVVSLFAALALEGLALHAMAAPPTRVTPVKVGTFRQEVARMYGVADGLPSADVQAIALATDGVVYAGTAKGLARLRIDGWAAVEGLPAEPVLCLTAGRGALYAATGSTLFRIDGAEVKTVATGLPHAPTTLAVGPEVILLGTGHGLFEVVGGRAKADRELNALLGDGTAIAQVAVRPDGSIAVAAQAGLYMEDADGWERVLPAAGNASWAVLDARGVACDTNGRLWFASPQGVGRLGEAWSLMTGHDGLPYNDFTMAAAGEDGVMWFGTNLGAIRYDGTHWAYREGRRWLPGNVVRGIAVTEEGHAWFATDNGVGCIERRMMTLAEKAQFYEDEIDKYHRRTPYEYVQWVFLEKPGDKSEWRQRDSDNDGQWTGEYGAAECFRYAATKDPEAKKRATKAFEALRFLSQVTQGGSHPVPKGYPARTIWPTGGPRNPNEEKSYSIQADEEERADGDGLWKILHPRWPTSEDGKWYWKCDTSSDELDGHYFLYGCYYDLVAETEEEKERVRQVVRDMTDHLAEHDYRLVDHDGTPTRWANYSPGSLNHDPDWWAERGLKSLSILSYLRTAEHITGDPKYGALADGLVRDHAFAMNVMCPKNQRGPGSFVQFDDEMAFMGYYGLLKHEKDPKLRGMYALSCHNYWELEACESDAFYNFVFAVSCKDVTITTPWGVQNLAPDQQCIEDAVDTLKRYPLDLVSWKLTNSHRLDVLPLPDLVREGGAAGKGYRVNGKVLPIDERFITYWSDDPWQLDSGNDGRQLATGMPYLLAYYMGLYHGFIVAE
jgi:hypothetical protein